MHRKTSSSGKNPGNIHFCTLGKHPPPRSTEKVPKRTSWGTFCKYFLIPPQDWILPSVPDLPDPDPQSQLARHSAKPLKYSPPLPLASTPTPTQEINPEQSPAPGCVGRRRGNGSMGGWELCRHRVRSHTMCRFCRRGLSEP